MDYFKGLPFEHAGIKVKGVSRAGSGTCIYVPEFKCAFDSAQGLPFCYGSPHFAITHSHMDHSGGIPFIIMQKALTQQKPGTFFMPEYMIDPLTKIMQTWSDVEGHQYEYQFVAAQAGQIYELKAPYFLRPFLSEHRVPTLGYQMLKQFKPLKPEFIGQSQQQIQKARQAGQQVDQTVYHPVVAYTGDTKIEFMDLSPHVLQTKILFMEVTYWDDRRSIDDARAWGHIHFDEVLPRLSEFKGEKLVFCHTSSRYSIKEVKHILRQKVKDPELLSKLEVGG